MKQRVWWTLMLGRDCFFSIGSPGQLGTVQAATRWGVGVVVAAPTIDDLWKVPSQRRVKCSIIVVTRPINSCAFNCSADSNKHFSVTFFRWPLAADFPSSFYGQHCVRGRNEARWRPGQEASLASLLDGGPIMIRRQGNCAPYAPLVTPLIAPWLRDFYGETKTRFCGFEAKSPLGTQQHKLYPFEVLFSLLRRFVAGTSRPAYPPRPRRQVLRFGGQDIFSGVMIFVSHVWNKFFCSQ